jgi:phospholipid/cholesterol/gamma-HCH transport system ATP-binding protein
MIDVIDLHKSFGSSHVLRGVTFGARKGETLVVLGRSGTGKSVMLKCVVGLLSPDEGKVLAEGREVAQMDRRELNAWRSRVGFLFQGGALYDSMSVAENLIFPLRTRRGIAEEEKFERASEKLRWVDLESAFEKNPSDLSGGMRKRAALARTLMTDPEVILYDEPTTGLDPVTSNEISQLIARLKDEQGVTSIVVTHDMPCARLVADRVAFLHSGRVLVEGTWDEVERCDKRLVQFFLATEFTREPIDVDED